MPTKRIIKIVLVASVLVLASGFGPQVANTARALPLAQASTTIPYSGSLTGEAGQPVADGAYDFTFALYTDEIGGEALWTEEVEGVTVQEGNFTVLLGSVNPLPKAALDGDARWLEVGVRGPGETGFTQLSPRQELIAATLKEPTSPSAASSCAHDHLYENWIGSDAGYSLRIQNSSTGDGIRGISYSTDPEYAGVVGADYGSGGSGVYGLANVSGIGVYGKTLDGAGVVGKSTNTSEDWQTGVWGEVKSTNGTFVRGVVGYATNTTGSSTGVDGASLSSTGTGVKGVADNGSCTSGLNGTCKGVYGYSNVGNGVFGESNTGSGVVGVSASGVAVRAEATGNAKGVVITSNGSGNFIEAYTFFPSNPRFKVDSVGNVTADGTYTSPAADLAEMLPAVDGLGPGDVLVIGEDGELARSNAAYQPTVVGVYSTKPGFVGGGGDNADLTGKIPLAVIGVVPVKVSAENGAIHPGDLLVASSTPGHAMKAGSDPAVGTVIGKALGSLESGTGVIQMLVMLQ